MTEKNLSQQFKIYNNSHKRAKIFLKLFHEQKILTMWIR